MYEPPKSQTKPLVLAFMETTSEARRKNFIEEAWARTSAEERAAILTARASAHQSDTSSKQTAFNVSSEKPQPILLAAIRGQNLALVLQILNKTPDLIKETDHGGTTAIMLAAGLGDTTILQALLDRSSLELINARDSEGNTALMRTVLLNTKPCFNMLLTNGADPEIKNNHGWNALMQTAAWNHPGEMKALFARNVQLHETDDDGDTALLHAARRKSTAAALELIARMEVENPDNRSVLVGHLDAKNNNGMTALMKAAIVGDTQLAEVLLAKGVNIHERNNLGDTAHDLALQYQQNDVVDIIVAHVKVMACATEKRPSGPKL